MAENEKIETLSAEEYEVEMEEVLPFVASGSGTMNHALLNNREISNQHPITAIEGLREELDEIKTLKEAFSNQYGHADYYLWKDGGNEAEDRSGYFVSVCEGDSSKIELYTKGEILGVVVDTAGFIGNKTEAVQTKCNTCGRVMDEHRTVCANIECQSTDVSYVRQSQYGLVATSGVVPVRCGASVVQGDYIMPDSSGVAAKVDNEYGYNVIEISSRLGVSYAIIDLGSFKSGAYNLGLAIDAIDERVTVNEKNIINVQNTANAAYLQSLENGNVSDDAVQKALEALRKANDTASDVTSAVGSIDKTAQNAVKLVEEAKGIAETAVTEAVSLGNAAKSRANDAWAIAGDAKETACSLCAKIDKYSVGEYSQAYGLTFDQTQSILKSGLIYVPTSHAAISGTKSHTESYSYSEEEASDEEPAYVRSFTPGYLYQWGSIGGGKYGWVTVDKDFNETSEATGDETALTNTSAMAVYFSNIEMTIGGANKYGYWYTDGDEIYDSKGDESEYEPYTLYHWENNRWVAVATLQGNVSNRTVSEFYQMSNSFAAEVFNARGSSVSLDARLSDTEATVQDAAKWAKGSNEDGDEMYNIATIKREADQDGSYLSLVVADEAGNKVLDGASIILGQSEQEGSSICLDASKIVLNGETVFTTTNAQGETVITGSNITTGCLKSEEYEEDESGLYAASGTSFDLDTGCIRSKNFAIDEEGNAYFNGELGANAISAIEVTADNITTGLIKSQDYEGDESALPYSSSGVAFDLDKNCIRSKNFAINSDGRAYFNGGKVGSLLVTQDTENVVSVTKGEVKELTLSITVPAGTEGQQLEDGGYYWYIQSQTYTVGKYRWFDAMDPWDSDVTQNVDFVSNGIQYTGMRFVTDGLCGALSYIRDTVQTCVYTFGDELEDGWKDEAYRDFNIVTTQKLGDSFIGLLNNEAENTAMVGKIKITPLNGDYQEAFLAAVTPNSFTISVAYGNKANTILATDTAVEPQVTISYYNLSINSTTVDKLYSEGGAFNLSAASKNSTLTLGKELAQTIQTTDLNASAATIGTINIKNGSIGACGTALKFGAAATRGSATQSYIATANLIGNTIIVHVNDTMAYDKTFVVGYEYNTVSYCTNVTVSAGDIAGMVEVPVFGEITGVWFEGAEGATLEFYETASIDEITRCLTFDGDQFIPVANSKGYLGMPDTEWYHVYAKNIYGDNIYQNGSAITSSDVAKKTNIAYFNANDRDTVAGLIDKLQPTSFQYTEGESGRTHWGFIAQDVKSALQDMGIDDENSAIYCEYGDTCGLRYEELIPILVFEIQQLRRRVADLEVK